MSKPNAVLVVGVTGSIGRLVVEESLRQGYATRALVRKPGKARSCRPQPKSPSATSPDPKR